jgi:epoxyqueuosine reductase
MDLVKTNIANLIRQEAKQLGFDDIGFSPAVELIEDKERLQKWLNQGYNAGMGYMANHFEKRVNPALLEEGSLSVITVLKNYNPADTKLSQNFPKISRYAYGIDYHDVIKEKLSQLFLFIQQLYPELAGRFFVDSAPILERSLAARAGLGWIGKNSMLINRKLGSYVFIGEMLVNIELPYAENPVNDGCGGCSRCVDACPTKAILPDKVIDANRCISYQTIENKGAIDDQLTGKFNNWVFGCDICQEVCPWNRKAEPHSEPQFVPSPELNEMSPTDWDAITPERFAELFKKSAIKRTKFDGLVRNIEFVKKARDVFDQLT